MCIKKRDRGHSSYETITEKSNVCKLGFAEGKAYLKRYNYLKITGKLTNFQSSVDYRQE